MSPVPSIASLPLLRILVPLTSLVMTAEIRLSYHYVNQCEVMVIYLVPLPARLRDDCNQPVQQCAMHIKFYWNEKTVLYEHLT